jgi:hypothetical protein
MTPAYSPERPQVEGNVYRIPTAFETRVRSAIITLAKREAREAVKRRLRAEGKVRAVLLSASEINTLANAYLKAHAAELLAQAEASGFVRNLLAEEAFPFPTKGTARRAGYGQLPKISRNVPLVQDASSGTPGEIARGSSFRTRCDSIGRADPPSIYTDV